MRAAPSRAQRRQLERDNLHQPRELQLVPRDQLPIMPAHFTPLLRVWRSRDFLVQERAAVAPALVVLNVCRTTHPAGHRFADGISWDQLQAIKHQCGYGDRDAVEIYPRDRDVVNDANMRHLWVLAEPLTFAWRRHEPST